MSDVKGIPHILKYENNYRDIHVFNYHGHYMFVFHRVCVY